jgi:type II secretory pathway pseudopilin PulG
MIMNTKSQKGFTLVELLLYVSLAAVLLLGMSIILAVVLGSRVKQSTIAEVDGQGILVMEQITQAVRNADSIIVPVPQASGGLLRLNIGGAETRFGSQGTVIGTQEVPGPPIILTSPRVEASNLLFENFSRVGTMGTVRVSFTLTHINPADRNEFDYSKTFISSASLRK